MMVIAALYSPSHYWLPDDAFYYFEIARNIADGHGSTFDQINPTNGYHPLWAYLLVLVGVLVRSPEAFVTVVLILQSLMICYVWTITYSLLFPQKEKRALLLAGLISILFTWNYYIAKTVINGLESALFIALAATFLWLSVRAWSDRTRLSWGRACVLGVVGALVILARLDGIFFVAGVLMAWIMIGESRPSQMWPRFAVVAIVPFAALGVYMYLNWRTFGLWMPVSGFVKRVVWPTGPTVRSVAAFGVFAAILFCGLRAAVDRRVHKFSSPAYGTAVALTVILAIYQADAWLIRGQILVEQWYLSPHLLWAFVISVLVADRLANSKRRRLFAFAMGTAATVGVTGIAASWAVRLERTSQDHPLAIREAADWINANLPETAVLAGWDVGQLAFYCTPRVVNLDGLVNSPEYVDYLRSNRTIEFMDKCGVEYVVQYFKPTFRPFGLRVEEFWNRVPQVVWRRDIEFAPMITFLKTGSRNVEKYHVDVRSFKPASQLTTLTHQGTE